MRGIYKRARACTHQASPKYRSPDMRVKLESRYFRIVTRLSAVKGHALHYAALYRRSSAECAKFTISVVWNRSVRQVRAAVTINQRCTRQFERSMSVHVYGLRQVEWLSAKNIITVNVVRY